MHWLKNSNSPPFLNPETFCRRADVMSSEQRPALALWFPVQLTRLGWQVATLVAPPRIFLMA
jgi:hypothetical protein